MIKYLFVHNHLNYSHLLLLHIASVVQNKICYFTQNAVPFPCTASSNRIDHEKWKLKVL